MYNTQFYNIWNYNYIQKQVDEQYRRNQMILSFDCAHKLKEFLDSVDKVDPQYQSQTAAECCAVLMDYAKRHGWVSV